MIAVSRAPGTNAMVQPSISTEMEEHWLDNVAHSATKSPEALPAKKM
ncbi:MAG TPA: hypothetical protein VHY48_05030 [Acidobacteriaceae bacterium]|nr:hypothetical protein [Acidobacteriaceae bacterium]